MAANQCEIKLVIFLLFSTHTYTHYLAEPGSIIRGVRSNGKHLLTRRNIDNSLKIKVFPDSSIQKLSSNLRELIVDRLLPDAIAYFEKTLTVRQRISPIKLQRNCTNADVFKKINGTLFRYCINECKSTTHCGTVLVPETHLDICRTCDSSKVHCTEETSKSAGVTNADFVLYIVANGKSPCDKKDVVAYASACQQEQTLDRPVAGFVNFCAEKLLRKFYYSHLLAVVKHEIFHALGFSSSLYGYYRADDGTPLTTRSQKGKPVLKWSDKVIKVVTRDQWKVSKRAGSSVSHNVQMIVTPRVVKEVRAHFNCPSLEGAEIENQGSSGQRHTHLEKRVFENEAMTGVFTNNPVFSRITLALMEDTGWYRANYEMAENLDWGRNASCIFAQNSCKAWMDFQTRIDRSISPYCAELPFETHTHTGCTHNYHGVGLCNLVKYKTLLPIAYRYFDSLPGVVNPSYYGGLTMLADYCPYFQELDWKRNGTIIRGSSCKHESNNPSLDENYAIETYGENSACFLHSRAWMQKSCSRTVTARNWGSGCYSYVCNIEGLVLSISGRSYPCWFAGQTLHVKVLHNRLLHEGTIICPACEDLCGSSCPFVETMFSNGSISEQSQDVLVCKCSLMNLHRSFWMLVPMMFLSVLVIEI